MKSLFLKRTAWVISTSLWLLSFSCSDIKDPTQSVLSVKIIGVSKAPSSATGSFDPISETIEVNSLTMTDENGNTIEMYQKNGKDSIRVIDRPQLLVERKLSSEEVGLTYTNLKFNISSSATARSLNTEEQDLTLSNSEYLYTSPFKLSKGKDLNFVIQLLWKNTVTRSEDSPPSDSISAPDFEIVISDDL